MPLKLYTDKHIHKAVAIQLSASGVDIVRCEEVEMGDAADEAHLAYATAENRAMVAGDADFLRLHSEWQDAGREHSGIFYIHPDIRHMKGRAVGILVRAFLFYHQAVIEGAASFEQDVYNQVNFITLAEWG